MRNEINYLGVRVCVEFNGRYVIPWDQQWERKPSRKLKSAPWTPAPSCANARGSTPGVYNDPMSGGEYDPNAEKSLGRYIGNIRFYSKQVADVDKSANKNNPLYYQVPSGESYELPEHESVDGVDYGLELLEASYSFVDEDGVQRYNPKWKPRYTAAERKIKYGV